MWAVCDNSIAHIRYQMGTNPGIHVGRSGYAQQGGGGGGGGGEQLCLGKNVRHGGTIMPRGDIHS